MGLFGGKKKKSQGEDESTENKRRRSPRSRRVVAPKTGGSSRDAAKKAKPSSQVKRGDTRVLSGTKAVAKPKQKTPQQKRQPSTPAPGGSVPESDVLELDLAQQSGAPSMAGDTTEPARQRGIRSTAGDQALLDFLVNKAGLINEAQAAQVRERAGTEDRPVDVVCYDMGLFNQDRLVKSLTEECWVPHLKVEKYAIRKKALDTISHEDALYFSVLPVDKLGSILNLAMVNPLDGEAIALLQQKTSLDIKKVVATRGEIEAGIARYYGGEDLASDTNLSIEQDVEPRRVTQMMAQVDSVNKPDEAPPPIELSEPEIEPASIEPIMSSESSDDLDVIDIDDLLNAEDEIKPEVIEPISIGEDEFDLEESQDDLVEAVVSTTVKRKDRPEKPSIAVSDEPIAVSDDQKADAAVISTEEIAISKRDHVDEDPTQVDVPILPAMPKKPVSSRPKKPAVVNLVPVGEEDFQHAITHGKARVFEKWVAIQTRNRILNAVALESEFEPLLTGLEQEEKLAVTVE